MTVSADWHDFATMIGGASGALTGLLFVAVSLNANRIAGYAGLRASAGQTLVLFITPLVIAAVRGDLWRLLAMISCSGTFWSPR